MLQLRRTLQRSVILLIYFFMLVAQLVRCSCVDRTATTAKAATEYRQKREGFRTRGIITGTLWAAYSSLVTQTTKS
jgi:hypothetical protein